MKIAPELVPSAPSPHLLDWPGWRWVAEARGAERPLDPLPLDAVFTTFPPGREPDVWPAYQRFEDEWGWLLIVVACSGFLAGLILSELVLYFRRSPP